jgi:hypothetical protein
MPEVTIGGGTITVERFTLSKAMRVITLLNLLRKEVPEISREWATYRRNYAQDYAVELDRINALARFGSSLDHVPDSEWERAGQKLKVPASPSQTEIFFELAPLIYEKAETTALRLIGLIAMPNETVNRYLKSDDIWERVDELVDEKIRKADMGEVLDLLNATIDVIEGEVLKRSQDLVGKTRRLFGSQTTTPSQAAPTTSSEQPEQPSSSSSQLSPSDTNGLPTPSEASPGTTSSASPDVSPVTA